MRRGGLWQKWWRYARVVEMGLRKRVVEIQGREEMEGLEELEG
jgi:hypothetical protein